MTKGRDLFKELIEGFDALRILSMATLSPVTACACASLAEAARP